MSPTPPPLVAPRRYVVPKVDGDPAAAYRLAEAYRDLADAVVAAQELTTRVIADLAPVWRGVGHRAIERPVEEFARNATGTARRLREIADALEAYGHHLAKAHHHHGFSLHKLLVVGAVVAVSAAAIVVTVGAAGVVEAAAASAAVGGAVEAAGAATAADVATANGIGAAVDGLAFVRPLLAFVVPNLLQVEWASGSLAVWDELAVGRLKWKGIAETGGVAFVAGAAAGRASELLDSATWSAALPGRVQAAAPHLVEGGVWAGGAAADDEVLEHRLDPVDISETFVIGGAGTLARDELRERGLWPETPDYRREALVGLAHQPGRIVDPAIAHELAVLRQSATELERGDIDLRLNEGPGHTIDRHISKSAGQLLTRVRTSRIGVASTYWDETTAGDAIGRTLTTHQDLVRRWIATGSPGTLRLRLTVPYDVGFAIDGRGRVRFIRQAMVVLRRDSAGIVLVTSYPLGRR